MTREDNLKYEKQVSDAIKAGNQRNVEIYYSVFKGKKEYYRILDSTLQRLRRKGIIEFEKGSWKILVEQAYLAVKS